MSACGRAACKHVRAYLDARPDWTQGLLQPALSYLGAVPLPVLAPVTADRVRLTSLGEMLMLDNQTTSSPGEPLSLDSQPPLSDCW